MNKNFFIFATLALALSACEGYNNAKPNNPATKVDPSGHINNQTQNINRNIGDRTSVVNQSGHKLP